MSDFDLNIDNYSISDIENLLKVEHPYSLNDVLKSEKMIIGVISKSSSYPVEQKSEYIEFMKSAKIRLTQHMRKQLEKTLQNEQELPDDEFVIQKDVGKVVNQISVTQSGGNSFVQHPETTSFNDIIDKNKYLNPLETYPTNIARSDLNNLKRKVIVQTVILNSLFREDYKNTKSTDFNLVLPYQFKNVLSVRLSSIQLPNVIYCFSSNKMNNIMFIEETSDDYHNKGTVILPDGNYSVSELAVALEKAINDCLKIHPPRFQVKGDEASQKITIFNDFSTFDMNFIKDVESIDFNSTLGWTMGFREKEYSCSARYTSEAVYNSAASDYIFFILNDFNNSQTQTILAMYSKSYIGDNILAMIPLKSKSYHMTFNDGSDFIEKKREYFGPVNLQRLKIELRNQFGELLDLNTMDFSFSLEVEMGYDW
tara:strand:+ start:43 stop:1317 length:1275 start_codon:yes stop_codon:yes gene_type:complete